MTRRSWSTAMGIGRDHLNGHRAKVFLSGLADVGALELGSRLIGDQAVWSSPTGEDTGARRRPDESLIFTVQLGPDSGGWHTLGMGEAAPDERRLPPWLAALLGDVSNVGCLPEGKDHSMLGPSRTIRPLLAW
jgi:hypothetical protein